MVCFARAKRAVARGPGSPRKLRMTRSTKSRGQVHPALAFALGALAVAGIIVAVLVSRPSGPAGPGPSDRPSTPPSSAADPTPVPTPVVTPKPTPAPTPTTAPSVGLGSIDLENATNHDVVLQIHDQTGPSSGPGRARPVTACRSAGTTRSSRTPARARSSSPGSACPRTTPSTLASRSSTARSRSRSSGGPRRKL